MAAAMRRLSIARILQPFLFSRYITQASNARLLLGNTYNVYGPLQCYSTRSSATKIRKKLKLPKDFARGSKPKLSKKSDGTTTLQATKNPSVAKHQNIETESIVVEYLNRQNVDISMIRRRLDLSRLKIAEVKKRVKFLLFELNLEASELGKMLTQRPVILVLKEEVLNSRLDTLHKVGISYEAMSYVVKHTPGILTSRVEETLPAKVEFLLHLRVVPKFVKNDVLHMLTKCPDLIASCSLESLETKIDFFQNKLEFNKHQLRNILIKQPSILTFSTQSVGEKFKYCYDKLYASPSSIAKCPRIFQCSMKRMKERHLFLVHLGRLKEDMIIDDYGLGVILTSPDSQFASKVAKSTKEDFDQFRKSL